MRLCAFADEAGNDLREQIKALHRNDISLIELRGVNGRNISAIPECELKEIGKFLADDGISVWSFGSPIGKIAINGNREAELDTFDRLCNAALSVGCTHMRIFSFFPTKEGQLERDEVLEGMYKYCLKAPREITLCLENEKGIYGDTPERCLELLSEFSRLRAIFDPANYVQCGVDTRVAWDMIAPYVEYLHIKDALDDGTVVPAGKGSGNVAYIIEQYLKNGGDVISLEPHLQHFSGLDALEHLEKTKINVSSLSQNDAFDLGAASTKSIIGGIKL